MHKNSNRHDNNQKPLKSPFTPSYIRLLVCVLVGFALLAGLFSEISSIPVTANGGKASRVSETLIQTVTPPPQAAVNIYMVLQGGSRPEEGWIVPLTVKLYTPGTNTPAYTFNLTTTKSGSRAVAQANGISSGTYDICVVSPGCLANMQRGVVITEPATDIIAGTLLAGNANDDNKISIQDFGILAAAYGKSTTDMGYDVRADFDRSGRVNIADFGLLSSNYAKNAPLEIPAPIPIPGVMLSVSAPATVVTDSTFDVDLNISTVNNLNASQFNISYDPTVIQIIGAEGGSGVGGGIVGGIVFPIAMWAFLPQGTPGKIRVIGFAGGPVSRSGYLARIHFQVIGLGGTSSTLDLSNVVLSDYNAEYIVPISVINGFISVSQ
jgi:hypothetical protein